MNIKKLTTMAMLTAISMIVFLIEAQIPIPIAIPGVKLGVANVITLFALWTLGWREAGAILVVRIFLGNLIVGNMMGMLYSMAGGVLCWVVIPVIIYTLSYWPSATTSASWPWPSGCRGRPPSPSMPPSCCWRAWSRASSPANAPKPS